MSILAILLSGFIVLVGVLAVLAPTRLMQLLSPMKSRGGVLFAAGFRVIWGVALWFSAAGSKDPEFLEALGIILIVAGLLMPLLGLKRFGKLLDWFRSLGSVFHRVWGVVAIGFGTLLIYTILG